jgi:molybdate transport system substrate-binding protein
VSAPGPSGGRRRSVLPAAAAAMLAGLAGGCAGNDDGPLTVVAASSLTEVFEELAPDARFEFAGSDELATQIREGVKADVYAAASPRYPDELYADGLVEAPAIFATNRLVLIVPRENPAGIESVADLKRDGTRLVIGDEGVPIGDYTRKVLESLGEEEVAAGAVSLEQDVKGVVGKVALGEADAGFVYASDVRPVANKVHVIELPAGATTEVLYPVAIVAGTEHRDEAREFVAVLLSEQGRAALERHGFGVP